MDGAVRKGRFHKFYIDKKGNLGDSPVTRKEFRHAKKQIRAIEAELDEITGNAFNTRFVRNPEYADVEIFHRDSITGGSAGSWSVGDYARNGKGQLLFDRDRDYGSVSSSFSQDQVKHIISHELGHAFGLRHTESYSPDSIMNPSISNTGTFLTPSDLDVLRNGWM